MIDLQTDKKIIKNTEAVSKDYVGYDYKEIITESNRASFLLDGYKNFGWEVDQNLTDSVLNQLSGGPAAYQRKVIIRLKRNRKIINKMELTRLQRNFEACVNEIERLQRSGMSTAVMHALTIGILGTVFMAGSVFAVTAQPPMIFLCVLLAIPGFAGWILPFGVYKRESAKKTEYLTELIEKKYDEIHEICEKGNKLLH